MEDADIIICLKKPPKKTKTKTKRISKKLS